MDPDKALSPDGFTSQFYRVCWETIKKFPKERPASGAGINSSFLFFIPKEYNPTTFGRFRTISLCNVSFKFCTKLTTNIMKPVLNKLISQN